MQRINPREAHDQWARDGVLVLDVRSESAFAQATEHIPRDHRYSPDHLEEWATGVPKDRRVVAYCT